MQAILKSLQAMYVKFEKIFWNCTVVSKLLLWCKGGLGVPLPNKLMFSAYDKACSGTSTITDLLPEAEQAV